MNSNNLFKKSLVFCIIVLFIVVSVVSCVSSEDITFSNDDVLEDNAEIGLVDNNESEPLNSYTEIISRVSGLHRALISVGGAAEGAGRRGCGASAAGARSRSRTASCAASSVIAAKPAA